MLGFRPKTTLYLERPRLLNLLPDSAGHVVWLEAPYGYGKSVLASQWAERLEGEGWRVLWLSLQGQEVKGALSTLLGLPEELLWSALLDALWQEPTILVLEDLEGSETLTPILKDVRGLLLLASRSPLSQPELPRLQTQARLRHLRVTDLAFTLPEATQLLSAVQAEETGAVRGEHSATEIWQQTGGWSLPLHFSLLTGELPEREALLGGVREGLPESVWREALLLSALPYLPFSAAAEESRSLARSGFAQELETGYRLHPLAADVVQRAYLRDLQEVVRSSLARLEPPLQAEALARAQLYPELAAHLEANYLLGRDDPYGTIRWDERCAEAGLGTRGPGRLLALGWAHAIPGHTETSARHLDAVLVHPVASADQKLSALGWRIFDLPPEAHDLATRLRQQGEALLGRGSRERAGIFLSNAAAFYLKTCAWHDLEAIQAEALGYLEGTEATATISAVRQQQTEARWELSGDLSALIRATEENLVVQSRLNPYNVPVNHYDLGLYKALLSNPQARQHFEQAEAGARHNVQFATTARAERAALLSEPEAFAPLAAQAQAWQSIHPETFERIYVLWARTLRKRGRAEAALEVLQGTHGRAISGERALALDDLGRSEAARAELPNPASCKRRLVRLELQAAHFLLTRDEHSLEALLELTHERERVLPALVPLTALPRHRPQLSAAYPLGEVLRAGWPEAARLRQAEIPPLELTLLGSFSARVLGRDAELTSKHRALLTLLALGYDREHIGEALWPDTESKKVSNNLHVQLNLLRKTLEPWGFKTYLSERGLSHTRTDFWLLQEALSRADAANTLALYREPFAPGTDLPLIEEVRNEVREKVVEVLFGAVRSATEPEAETYLTRLLELEPLHEEALANLLERLMRSGRRREALRRYKAFAEKLREELNLEPLPRTQQICAEGKR